jgi:hypothetical protein
MLDPLQKLLGAPQFHVQKTPYATDLFDLIHIKNAVDSYTSTWLTQPSDYRKS